MRNDKFNAEFDDCHDDIVLGELTFSPSDVLYNCDPIAYRCYVADWEADNGYEEEEDDK